MGLPTPSIARRRKTTRETILKTRKPAGKLRDPDVKSLPADLLVEVLGRVASSSFTDLYNAKLCCKEFNSAANNEYILQKISIDKFPVIPWFTRDEEVIGFLNRCKDTGNPEALYRQGMIEYFSSRNVKLGLEYLKRAAEKGHTEASYVYGIILLSGGGQSAQHGLKLLNSVLRSSSLSIKDCRERTKAIIGTMWIKNYIVRQQISTCCHEKEATRWDFDEEDVCCDARRWDREVDSFSKTLRGHV